MGIVFRAVPPKKQNPFVERRGELTLEVRAQVR